MNFAIQLYSLRDFHVNNLPLLLQDVKNMGYDGVEFAGFNDMKAKDVKNVLDNLALKSEGSHTSYELLSNKINEVIEYNNILGTDFIILPWYSFNSEEDYFRLAEFCNKTGEKIKNAGMKFLYHNHDMEITPGLSGKRGLDILKDNTEKDNLSFQLDVYWVKYAMLDPLEYIKELGNRCATFHIKDMNGDGSKAMTEVGTGIIDFHSILSICKEKNITWTAVEQDEIFIDPYVSMKTSLDNIRSIASKI